MPISKNFTSIYTHEWEINFTQCSPNGFLKYTELCNILQLAAGEHASLGGIDFEDLQIYNQAWVLSRFRAEIIDLPKWKDKVVVKTWINTLEYFSSVRCMEMYLNDKKIISAESLWVIFNTKLRCPEMLKIPHEHFEKFPTIFATEKRVNKIDITKNTNLIQNQKVKISDLDIVNHVNNVKYFEWCLNLIDYNLIINKQITSFNFNFLKELTYDNEFEIYEALLNNESQYIIKHDKKICFIMDLKY